MTAPLVQRLSAWAQRMLAALLASAGPVPQHIAFIMDGNRRYAEQRHLRRVQGHSYGFAKLIAAAEWCLDLGVRHVSVYAFSIDNYKRSGEEVETLMALAEEKLAEMLQERHVLARRGVQVRLTGDLTLAPPSVRAAAQQVMDATRGNTAAVLNICFSYTASEEMLRALDAGNLNAGSLEAAHTAEAGGNGAAACTSGSHGGGCGGGGPLAALDARLYTAGCPPVDLLIRTSGETRLSDFLLWQCRHALLVFTDVLWPDISFLDLAAAILRFQAAAGELRRLRAAAAACEPAARAAAAVAEAAQAREAATAAQAREADQEAGPLPLLQAVKTRLLAAQGPHLAVGLAVGEAGDGGASPRAVTSPDEPPSSPSSSDGSADQLGPAPALGEVVLAGAPPPPQQQQLRLRRPAGPLSETPPPLGPILALAG
eukprot:scaffold20.g7833.t1